MSTAITIGTRVRTDLYARGHGTVFAIHGEQAPDQVRNFSGVVAFGGRAHFDIVFDRGCLSLQLPECILRGVQWQILDEVVDKATIAAALVHADAEQARRRADEAAAKASFDAEVARLRADEDFADLIQGCDTSSGKLAAKNIRIQLRRTFRGTKFSVRVRDHGSIDIEWSDGPTSAAVTAVIKPYQSGTFDGMEDIYRSAVSPWNSVFGGAKYVFTSRAVSDALIARAIAAVFATYAGNFAHSGITATIDDYRAGRLFAVRIPLLGDSLETEIRLAANDLEG